MTTDIRPKPHVRLTSRGWFAVWEILTGTVDFESGREIPDCWGQTKRTILVGPYDSMRDAIAAG